VAFMLDTRKRKTYSFRHRICAGQLRECGKVTEWFTEVGQVRIQRYGGKFSAAESQGERCDCVTCGKAVPRLSFPRFPSLRTSTRQAGRLRYVSQASRLPRSPLAPPSFPSRTWECPPRFLVFLVPKSHLGMSLSSKLRFFRDRHA
jgi:hypothetical protein